MSDFKTLRVMTYNVHSCLGRRGYDSLEDIVEVVKEYNPDILSVQELDVEVGRSRNIDQPKLIAQKLAYSYQYCPARMICQGSFGNAIFSRFPVHAIQAQPLASSAVRPVVDFRQVVRRPRESRSALWVRVEHPLGGIQVINTHLSLLKDTREFQIQHLLGEGWIQKVSQDDTVVFTGDFNLGSGARAYQWLVSILSDAQVDAGQKKPQATFPASSPVRNIDHIFYRGRLQPVHTFVPRVDLTRKASDHLPLIVDFEI